MQQLVKLKCHQLITRRLKRQECARDIERSL